MNVNDLIQALEETLEKGAYTVLRESEESKGADIIAPNSSLLAGEWPDDIIVTKLGKDIRIVAIYNLFQGNGAFSRLINRIIDFGFRPVVVCPSNEMRNICKQWGWKEQIVGSTFHDREGRFIPTKKWMQQRSEFISSPSPDQSYDSPPAQAIQPYP